MELRISWDQGELQVEQKYFHLGEDWIDTARIENRGTIFTWPLRKEQVKKIEQIIYTQPPFWEEQKNQEREGF